MNRLSEIFHSVFYSKKNESEKLKDYTKVDDKLIFETNRLLNHCENYQNATHNYSTIKIIRK
jgi:hypothetical protein